MIPSREFRATCAFLCVAGILGLPSRGWASAEVKFDRDFLTGVIEKMPPIPFQKDGHYRGTVSSYRLQAIDPKLRRLLLTCEVAGEFRPPIPTPHLETDPRNGHPEEHWRSFRFDVRVGINIEAAGDGTPRFRVEVEEIKRRELEGFAGTVAKVLGKSFDSLVKQVAEGKASRLNERLNNEILKHIKIFQDYGILYGIDYTSAQIVLHFDVSRYTPEGVAGYVFPAERPGTVPLYRWAHVWRHEHVYTTNAIGPDRRIYKSDGIAGYALQPPLDRDRPALSLPCSRWDHFYTTADGEGVNRRGYCGEGVACYLYAVPKPGTVPFYRFVEPRTGLHFYTTHPHAEFVK